MRACGFRKVERTRSLSTPSDLPHLGRDALAGPAFLRGASWVLCLETLREQRAYNVFDVRPLAIWRASLRGCYLRHLTYAPLSFLDKTGQTFAEISKKPDLR